jgi:MYXO-CTERM domain-containing protein
MARIWTVLGFLGAAAAILIVILSLVVDSSPGGRGSSGRHIGLGPSSATQHPDPLASSGRQPLRFEENQGQFDQRARFVARGPGYKVFLDGASVTLTLNTAQSTARSIGVAASGLRPSVSQPSRVIRLRFADASSNGSVLGEQLLTGVSNYLIGNDPSHWRYNVPSFASVRYRGTYEGIDVVFHGSEGRLEYDFAIQPGGDADRIRLVFDGIDDLHVDEQGALHLVLGSDEIIQPVPDVFQTDATNQPRRIRGTYVALSKSEVGIRVDGRDDQQPMLIDPVLIYSTYLGGSGANGDLAYGVAVDSAGSAYLTGITDSSDFPTTGPLQGTFTGGSANNAFVTKFDRSGASLVYSTYLGGTNGQNGGQGDFGRAIAVDSVGAVYVGGNTQSTDFPITSSAVKSVNASQISGFVSKLDPTGQTLVYSTFVGGSAVDVVTGVSVDDGGAIYVAGVSESADLPLVNSLYSNAPGPSDRTGLFQVIDPSKTGSAGLLVSSYLQATVDALSLDGMERVYLCGTALTHQTVINGVDAGLSEIGGAFIARLNPKATGFDYMRSIGEAGQAEDEATSLAIDRSGAVYIAGNTNDLSFPTTANAFQATNPSNTGTAGDNNEAFVAKLSSDGTTWEYASYLGGSMQTSATGIVVNPGCDAGCSASVVGFTGSSDFPSVQAIAAWGSFQSAGSAYISEFNSDASVLNFSTAFFISPNAIAADPTGNSHIAGGEYGPPVVTLNPFQSRSHGGNAALAKLGVVAPPPTLSSISPQTGDVTGGTAISLSGGYLGSLSTVSIGGVVATNIVLVSATELTAVTGAHAAGAVDVVVTNGDGQMAKLAGGFTYTAVVADAGVDAGSDAGPLPDAGPPDAGVPDAGNPPDAGLPDAGLDGGVVAPKSGGCGCQSSAAPESTANLVLLIAFVAALRFRRARSCSASTRQ